ncbi:hypothetical protein C3B79_2443 [Aeromonas hydrophila]|nr:hypothetical protein C3B79_2443 [Aeromonas hydrophila]
MVPGGLPVGPIRQRRVFSKNSGGYDTLATPVPAREQAVNCCLCNKK